LANTLGRAWAAVYGSAAHWAQRRAAYDTVEVVLSGRLPERWLPSMPFEFPRLGRMTHRRLIMLLDALAADPKVKRIILQIGPLSVGLARLQEIARALDRLKTAGKTLYALFDSLHTREYVLAARCHHRWMVPTGTLSLTGLRLEVAYWRGLLDKADVEADLLVAGKFKSAAEPFTRQSAGELTRAQTEGLLGGLYEQVLDDLAAGLGRKKDQVAKLVDGGPYTAARALDTKLIDRLGYRDELLAELQIKDERRVVRGHRYLRLVEHRSAARARLKQTPIVALVHLSGMIRDGRGEPTQGTVGALGYVRLLRRLRLWKDVKAVVLRVASPGGVAGGSDLIRRELAKLAEAKPVVVSLGDVAASGGYLVAVGAPVILAERGTLTGSIGVIAGKFATGGLLNKFGVHVEVYQRGAAAGIFSGVTRFTAVERRRMKEILTAAYGSFKQAVAEGRKLAAAEVEGLAEGRVWNGVEAAERKMIDEIGGLREALDKAKQSAGCPPHEPARLLEWPVPPSPWRMLWSLNAAQRLPAPVSWLMDLHSLTGQPFAGLLFRLRVD
jgi:protease-4